MKISSSSISRFYRASILGFLVAIGLLLISILPFGLNLEENVGLNILFKLRGPRNPPPDVAVISIDKESAEQLNIPLDVEKWPRSLHARLIDNLIQEGVSLIVFDLFFNTESSEKEDKTFARSIQKGKNVILCECLQTEKVPLFDKRGKPKGDYNIVKVASPIPLIAQSAIASAPFPIPKIPVRVNQYWTFKTLAGDQPTLPVVAFQTYTLQICERFLQLLKSVSPARAEQLLHNKKKLESQDSIENSIRNVRNIFLTDPQIAGKMLQELELSKNSFIHAEEHDLIKSLIKMYQSPHSLYLNFYGPARTITTIPYHRILNEDPYPVKKRMNLQKRVVFVGLSEITLIEENEGYYTVFSLPDGVDISGVEIAATAFANLLEDVHIRPINIYVHIALFIILGVSLGIICRSFSTPISVFCVFAFSVLYLFFAYYQFKHNHTWYPVVFPLFFLVPLTFFGSVLWNYIQTKKEREGLKKAFEYYLPNDVIQKLSKDIAQIGSTGQLVYGICLYTDAEQYTSLSETLRPEELRSFMNRYYETIFHPIRKYGGSVSNVIGDSVLALWVSLSPDAVLKRKACSAALDIANALHEFKLGSDTIQLRSRISVHSGHILLGNIGAIDHYEYRPIGDIVNTTTRIDRINRDLKTRILVSGDVIHLLEGFLTREIGQFLLVGKSNPLTVYELCSHSEDVGKKERNAKKAFADALDAFRKRSWEDSMEKFNTYIQTFGEDGPSLYYIDLCRKYLLNPPDESWEGMIQMHEK